MLLLEWGATLWDFKVKKHIEHIFSAFCSLISYQTFEEKMRERAADLLHISSSGETALRMLPDWLKSIVLHFEVLVGREWHGAPEYSELVLNNWKIHPKDAKRNDKLMSPNLGIHHQKSIVES